MKISCSRCGADHEFRYCAGNVLNAVYNLGWGSYGAALYCPECTATWDERNKGRPQPGPESTIGLIDELYSTYTNCIYKVLFGMDANQLREKFGIGKKDSLRDFFSKEELRAVQSMECLVSGLVDCGWDYNRVKDFIAQNNALRQLAA